MFEYEIIPVYEQANGVMVLSYTNANTLEKGGGILLNIESGTSNFKGDILDDKTSKVEMPIRCLRMFAAVGTNSDRSVRLPL